MILIGHIINIIIFYNVHFIYPDPPVQFNNKPYSRMSISLGIPRMSTIFVISGQIFLKWN